VDGQGGTLKGGGQQIADHSARFRAAEKRVAEGRPVHAERVCRGHVRPRLTGICRGIIFTDGSCICPASA
jgi:hypothetical protein